MFEKFRKPVFKNTVAYVITDGLAKGISFLLLPLISIYLIPEELGMAANFDVLVSILILLAGMALVNSLPYFYYGRSRREIAVLVSSLLLLILVLNIFLGIVMFICCDVIYKYFHLSFSFQALSIVLVISRLVSDANMILYRLEDKPIHFSILQITQTIIYVILLVLFVVDCKKGGAGKILSAVISYGMMAFVHLVLLYKRAYLTLSISGKEVRELAKFGLPLLPHSLSFWIKGGMDKVILTSYCGLAINGLYSMAMSFGAVYSIFVTAFNNAYVPYLQKRLNQVNPKNEACEKSKLVGISYKLFVCFVSLSFLSTAFCWVAIEYVLDDKYESSFQFVPWILLSLTINTFYCLVIQYPYTVKKTFGLGIITFTSSVVQCLLTLCLVRWTGIDGVKISLPIGSLITTLAVWWYSNKVYPMPWFKIRS